MSAVNPNTAFIPNAYEQGKKQRIVGSNDLASADKDMFLKLMIAQMRNQDPTSPMDSKEMMAGITQMSQVEQFMNMSKSMESLALSQSVGMVGKGVEYTGDIRDSAGNVVEQRKFHGSVDHVVQDGGVVKLVINVIGYEDRMAAGTPEDPKLKTVPAGTTATISAAVVTRIG